MNTIHRTGLALSFIIIPAHFAYSAEESETLTPIKVTALGGVTFGSNVSQNYKYQGTSLATTDSKGNTSPSIGLEGMYRLPSLPLSFGLLTEWSQFKDNSGDHPDTEFGIYALGKVHKTIESFDLWAGFGLGVMFLSLGTGSTTNSGYLFSTPSTSYQEFIFTPRLGFDYSVRNDLEIGLQVAYYNYGGNMDVDATRISDGASIRFQDEFKRTWWTTQARVGVHF